MTSKEQNRIGVTGHEAEKNNAKNIWDQLGKLYDKVDDMMEEVKQYV